MASKRDVELVIRAKNEATKAIDSVAEALKVLADIQNDVTKSAGKTGSLLDRLGDELKKLNAESKGLEALSKVAVNLDKAGSAVGRLEKELEGTNADLTRLKKELQDAATGADRLKAAVTAAADALAKQKAATAAARTEQTNSNKEVRAAEASINRLVTRIAAAKKPNDDLTVALAKQQRALSDLKTKQTAAADGYARQQAATKAAAGSLREFQEQARIAASQQKILETAADRAAGSLERQSKTLKEAKADLAAIQGVAHTAANALGGVAIAEDKISAASTRTAESLAKVTAALSRQSSVQATTTPSGANLVTLQYRAQVEAVTRAKDAYALASAEATKLGAALKTTVAPTSELHRAFTLSVAAAKQAKVEYADQAVALNRLRGVTQGTVAAFIQRTAQTAATARADREATNSATGLGGVLRALAQALIGVGNAAGGAQGKIHGLRGAFRAFYGESRQALSLFQRIRGELLGLSAQYVGLYAAIQNIGGVITAYRTIEAAQNRLGAVFKQDAGRISEEMRFLQAQANRLGIEFGALSDEYTKFAIAADAANFSNENTRKIFLGVAEAGRVNKLSLDQMRGVFLALQQMISKGKVTSEELRRQMGDRLPGAFSIFAKALGKTTAELDAMLQAGDVFATEGTLLAFADELGNRFGNQLPEALRTVTTEIGRFQNNIFQAQVQVAKGGFIEALRVSLENLNKFFRSSEGAQFFTTLGTALGKFVMILSEVPKWFGLIGTAIKLIIAYKLAQVFTQIGAAIVGMTARSALAGRSMVTFSGNTRALIGTMAGLRGALISVGLAGFATSIRGLQVGLLRTASAVGVLRIGFVALAGSARLLMVALGGPIGALIAVGTLIATELFANWATDVDTATDALAEHERIMVEVAEAYAETNGKIDDMGKKLRNISIELVTANLDRFKNAISEVDEKLKSFDTRISTTLGKGGGVLIGNEEERKLKNLLKLYNDAKISVEQFDDQLTELAKTLKTPAGRDLAEDYRKIINLRKELMESRINEIRIAKEMGAGLTQEEHLILDLSESLKSHTTVKEDVTEATRKAAEAEVEFNESLRELKKEIPSLKDELERTKKFIDLLTKGFLALKAATAVTELNQFGAALSAIARGDGMALIQALAAIATGDFSKLGAVLSTLGQGVIELDLGQNQVLDDLRAAAGSLEAAAVLIKNKEGFQATGKWDKDAFRAGFGSSTITLSNNTIVDITKGMRVSVADANRDLTRRIGDYITTIQKQVGPERFAEFSKEQVAVLSSLSHNYGELPDRILRVIKEGGSSTQIAAAIRALQWDNPEDGFPNRARRNAEANIFANPQGDLDTRLAKEKEITLEKQKQAEKDAEARAAIQQKIEDGTFEISQLQETGRQQAINKAIYDAENEAKRAGIALTETERIKIAENAAALFDAANKEKEAAAAKEAVEKRVNDLYELRKALQEQITFLDEQGGQSAKVEQLKAQLTATDLKLKEAIIDAQAFYAKMSGPEADLAIAKLDGMSQSIQTFRQGLIDAKAVNDMLVGGLVTAFSSVAESIAGVIDGTLTLKEGLKAVGQAFLKFAADFLLQLGQMILKQALLNALTGGTGGGGAGGFLAGLFHKGGIAGRSVPRRRVNPMWFQNAPRLHMGGMPGLRRNEIPAILKQNEEVLSENDPRHVANGGLAKSNGYGNVKIVNAIDAGDFVSQGIQTRPGERAIMNFMRSNSEAIRNILGG